MKSTCSSPPLRLLCAGLLSATLLSGCAAFMAIRQPAKKDLRVLAAGTPRQRVIEEMGQPQWTTDESGERVDRYFIVQGFSEGNRAGRAILHGAATVATVGLWDWIGTPFEYCADGTELLVTVRYDGKDRVFFGTVHRAKNGQPFPLPASSAPPPATPAPAQ